MLKDKEQADKNKITLKHWLMLLATFSVILAFVINLLVPSKDFSKVENRNLKQRPKISISSLADGSFFKSFDDYYSDQVVFRDNLMQIKAVFSKMLLNKEINDVYLGKNSYLFSKTAPVNTDFLKAKAKTINDFSAKNKDKKITMLLAPNAASVLEDKLPTFSTNINQIDIINDFYSQIKEPVVKLDAAKPLKDNSSNYVFYKTDHHWTSRGAYEVFKANHKNIGIDKIDTEMKAYKVSEKFKGTLASKTGINNIKDTIEVYASKDDVKYIVTYPTEKMKSTSIFDSKKLKEKDQYQVFLSGNHPIIEIKTTNENGKNLLILKDSYANSFVQFLIDKYEKIIIIDPRYYYEPIDPILSTASITDIMFLYSGDTFFQDSNLQDLLETSIKKDS